jgi:hypothetical protein
VVAGKGQEPLDGGFVNRVVRVGATVRRSSGPWTPAVHALLRHLEAVGFSEAPRVLGMDEEGREILGFIEGETIGWTDWPPVMTRSDGLRQLGSLLRRYHDAVRGFRPPDDAVWRNPLAPSTGELVRHGDFVPFNTVWRDDRVVGVIDWDFAQPGAAISDLSHLAWYAVPLSADWRVEEYGFANGIDRAERLRVLCAAYGEYSPVDVVDEAVELIAGERTQTAELAERRLAPWTTFVADGSLAGFDAEVEWIRANRAELIGASA